MGWYDDEESAWLPNWAIASLAWLGCGMAAVLPAGVVLALWNALLPDAPLAASLTVYALSLGLMIAAVKPWTIR
ncbi:hypothetical protein [Caulobacter soli]|uniref:hypothetical protein n=1 Tax=Caulobacter soli TaxID=2708539 RepID=UPI0013EBB417|nr:hypothetical protein [Caulobacter soli]